MVSVYSSVTSMFGMIVYGNALSAMLLAAATALRARGRLVVGVASRFHCSDPRQFVEPHLVLIALSGY
jgi:hypothetical protein